MARGDILERAGEDRYEVLEELGEGTFGKVVACTDRRTGEKRAVKVIKSVEKYCVAAGVEIYILEDLRHLDPEGLKCLVHLESWFRLGRHYCMVFPMLGESLFDYLRRNAFEPFSITEVADFAYQLLVAVNFMHENRLTHTDLKPENILLVNSEDSVMVYNERKKTHLRRPRCTDIRVIDLGSATYEDSHHTRIVSTRHYRAPEILLELGWSTPCDMWSLGCITYELFTGAALFQTHDNLEHLAIMERCLGPIPPDMGWQSKKHYFSSTGTLLWPSASSSSDSIRYTQKQLPISKIVMPELDETRKQLHSFIRQLLIYRPDERVTARQALEHPFVQEAARARQHHQQRRSPPPK